MTRFAVALLTLFLAAACSAEPPNGSAAATAPRAEAPPAQSAPAQSAPAQSAPAPAPAERPAGDQARVAEAPPAQPPANSRWVAGRHFRVLNPAQPTTVAPGKVEVVDVFWYGCGGCNLMAPYMTAWKESKPAAAEYVLLPAVLNPGWQPHARLFYATKALGIQDQTHAAIFREYHGNRNPLNTPDLMVKFLGNFGVSEASARDALSAFGVDAELRAAEVRARRYQLTFVPAVVVNGKYVIGVEQAGGPDAVLELINYLVAVEAAN
jgi:protein dithiol oxidoreductase (disulfide-forming)